MKYEQVTILTRKQLYDQVWSTSILKLAEKYGISYAMFRKQVIAAKIPIPAPGYWTKLEFGKPAQVIELEGDYNQEVVLCAPIYLFEKDKKPYDTSQIISSDNTIPPLRVITGPEGELFGYLDCSEIYHAIWKNPMEDVLREYEMTKKGLKRFCKAESIPFPSSVQIKKISSGNKINMPRYFAADKRRSEFYLKNQFLHCHIERISGLSHEDKRIVLSIAAQLNYNGENRKLQHNVSAYMKEVSCGHYGYPTSDLSDAVQKRAVGIMDAIITPLENMGILVDDQLNLTQGKDTISFHFTETRYQQLHVETEEEKQKMAEYESRISMGRYARKPHIHKYDNIPTGRLSVSVGAMPKIKDSSDCALEDKLDEIFVSVFFAFEKACEERLTEEKEKIRLRSEAAKRIEMKAAYEKELENTVALMNQAQNFDISCKIRAMIAAVETQNPSDAQTLEWIKWAKAKADWYDPTTRYNDPILGKRCSGPAVFTIWGCGRNLGPII